MSEYTKEKAYIDTYNYAAAVIGDDTSLAFTGAHYALEQLDEWPSQSETRLPYAHFSFGLFQVMPFDSSRYFDAFHPYGGIGE